MKLIGMMLIVVGMSIAAKASVPEIDASSGLSALTLLGGALLVFKSRRKG